MIIARPEKMYLVQLYGMKNNKEQVMREMQRYGAVHIRERKTPLSARGCRKKEDAIIHDAVKNTERIERMKSFFSPKRSLIGQLFEEKRNPLRLAGYSDNSFRFWSNRCVSRIHGEYEKIAGTEKKCLSKIEEIKKTNEVLSHFAGLDADLGSLGEGKYFFRGLGKTTAKKFPQDFFVENISVSDAGENYVFFCAPLERRGGARKIIHVFDVNEAGTAKDVLLKNESELERLKSSLAALGKKKKEFEKNKSLLLAIEERWQNIKFREAAAGNLEETKHTFCLEGWVPESSAEKIAAINGAAVYFSEEKEFAPTKLKNPKLAKPFELLTRNYSIPKYGGIDPTIMVALAFTAFFGFMFMDIAYSAMLAIVSAILVKKGTNTAKDIGSILFLGSISGAVFGILGGSVFGNLVNFKSYFSVFTAPFLILAFSLMVGVLHINLGLFMRLYEAVRKKDRFALKDGLSWVGIETGAALVLAPAFFNLRYPAALGAGALIISWAVAFRLKEGVCGIMKSIDFFGNFLSYMRLMALALVTGWLALATNLVSKILLDVSIIFSAIVFTTGHAANFILNTVSSAMHALRLNYVEFFGTFYDGGGVEYMPLAARYDYHKSI